MRSRSSGSLGREGRGADQLGRREALLFGAYSEQMQAVELAIASVGRLERLVEPPIVFDQGGDRSRRSSCIFHGAVAPEMSRPAARGTRWQAEGPEAGRAASGRRLAPTTRT